MPTTQSGALKIPAEPGRIDLAFWNAAATTAQFEVFLSGARNAKARAVCVPSSRVALAFARLEDTPVKVVALAGFPLGITDADAKRFEAETAIDNGAQEIELVLSTGQLKDGDTRGLLRELRDVVECAEERPVVATIESSALTREQIILACHLVMDSGAAGVSCSTGFWPGITPDAAIIPLLREATSPKLEIKAAPVSTEQQARALLASGATRLGMVIEPAPGT